MYFKDLHYRFIGSGREERGAELETSEHLFAHFVPAAGMVKAVEVVAILVAMVEVISIATSLVSIIEEAVAVVMLSEGQISMGQVIMLEQVSFTEPLQALAISISMGREQVRELELESLDEQLAEVLAIMEQLEQSTIVLDPDITSLREHAELQQEQV